MRTPRTLGLTVVATGLALAAVVQWWPAAAPFAEEAPAEAVPQGRPLAPFSWTSLDGRTLTSESVKGKVLLVNFWATWCVPCREEFPSLVALQSRHHDDLMVIGLAFDEAPEREIAAFAKEHHAHFPIVVASGLDAEMFGGIIGMPTTFVVNRSGQIVFSHIGYASAQIFEDAVKAALGDGGL